MDGPPPSMSTKGEDCQQWCNKLRGCAPSPSLSPRSQFADPYDVLSAHDEKIQRETRSPDSGLHIPECVEAPALETGSTSWPWEINDDVTLVRLTHGVGPQGINGTFKKGEEKSLESSEEHTIRYQRWLMEHCFDVKSLKEHSANTCLLLPPEPEGLAKAVGCHKSTLSGFSKVIRDCLENSPSKFLISTPYFSSEYLQKFVELLHTGEVMTSKETFLKDVAVITSIFRYFGIPCEPDSFELVLKETVSIKPEPPEDLGEQVLECEINDTRGFECHILPPDRKMTKERKNLRCIQFKKKLVEDVRGLVVPANAACVYNKVCGIEVNYDEQKKDIMEKEVPDPAPRENSNGVVNELPVRADPVLGNNIVQPPTALFHAYDGTAMYMISPTAQLVPGSMLCVVRPTPALGLNSNGTSTSDNFPAVPMMSPYQMHPMHPNKTAVQVLGNCSSSAASQTSNLTCQDYTTPAAQRTTPCEIHPMHPNGTAGKILGNQSDIAAPGNSNLARQVDSGTTTPQMQVITAPYEMHHIHPNSTAIKISGNQSGSATSGYVDLTDSAAAEMKEMRTQNEIGTIHPNKTETNNMGNYSGSAATYYVDLTCQDDSTMKGMTTQNEISPIDPNKSEIKILENQSGKATPDFVDLTTEDDDSPTGQKEEMKPSFEISRINPSTTGIETLVGKQCGSAAPYYVDLTDTDDSATTAQREEMTTKNETNPIHPNKTEMNIMGNCSTSVNSITVDLTRQVDSTKVQIEGMTTQNEMHPPIHPNSTEMKIMRNCSGSVNSNNGDSGSPDDSTGTPTEEVTTSCMIKSVCVNRVGITMAGMPPVSEATTDTDVTVLGETGPDRILMAEIKYEDIKSEVGDDDPPPPEDPTAGEDQFPTGSQGEGENSTSSRKASASGSSSTSLSSASVVSTSASPMLTGSQGSNAAAQPTQSLTLRSPHQDSNHGLPVAPVNATNTSNSKNLSTAVGSHPDPLSPPLSLIPTVEAQNPILPPPVVSKKTMQKKPARSRCTTSPLNEPPASASKAGPRPRKSSGKDGKCKGSQTRGRKPSTCKLNQKIASNDSNLGDWGIANDGREPSTSAAARMLLEMENKRQRGHPPPIPKQANPPVQIIVIGSKKKALPNDVVVDTYVEDLFDRRRSAGTRQGPAKMINQTAMIPSQVQLQNDANPGSLIAAVVSSSQVGNPSNGRGSGAPRGRKRKAPGGGRGAGNNSVGNGVSLGPEDAININNQSKRGRKSGRGSQGTRRTRLNSRDGNFDDGGDVINGNHNAGGDGAGH